uniref:Uncharacterized protein n=1 Tax=Klebsiella phage vB_KpnM_Iguana_ER37 TaxID=3076781 RepID=A0AB38Z479_9CAUD
MGIVYRREAPRRPNPVPPRYAGAWILPSIFL